MDVGVSAGCTAYGWKEAMNSVVAIRRAFTVTILLA
jgi:hypothetical protein